MAARAIAVYAVASSLLMTLALLVSFGAEFVGAMSLSDNALRVAFVLALSWPVTSFLYVICFLVAAIFQGLRGPGAGTHPPVV